MNRNRRAKIIATLGPASGNQKMIKTLWKEGADVFRINMSHTDHKTMKKIVRDIRKVEAETGTAIGILADIQGPKHRLGVFQNGTVKVAKGDVIVLDKNKKPGNKKRVCLPHDDILKALKPGHRILVNDGKVKLKIVGKSKDAVKAQVVSGNELSDRKGVNLPDSELKSTILTPKDRADIKAILKEPIDWIGVSFIQNSKDLEDVKKITKSKIAVMSKVEKPQAVKHLDKIIEGSDAIMVARGDLGVEMPPEAVPAIQKKIIRKCRVAGKPVVVATQMLESMISSPVPTRAEVSDVANAVYEGADAVMLSAESATGHYPKEAVRMMNSIAVEIENDKGYRRAIQSQKPEPEPIAADAISFAAAEIADTLNLSAIVCYTASGSTGLRMARVRPSKPILALTPVRATARRLALTWGLRWAITPDAKNLDEMVEKACRIARDTKVVDKEGRIIMTAGVPLKTPGATNMIRIAYVNDYAKKNKTRAKPKAKAKRK